MRDGEEQGTDLPDWRRQGVASRITPADEEGADIQRDQRSAILHALSVPQLARLSNLSAGAARLETRRTKTVRNRGRGYCAIAHDA